MPANLFLTLNLQAKIEGAVLELYFDPKQLNAGCVEIRTDGSSAQFGVVS